MKRFLVGLFMAIPVLSFAQSNFQKGYLVTNSQDTIRGFIDYKETNLNPSELSFRLRKDGNTEKFTLENCAAYAIDGFESYRRFEVNMSLSEIKPSELSLGLDTSFKRGSVFLRLLQPGKFVSLYDYQDGLKRRFYIQEGTTKEPVELINAMFVASDGSGKIIENNKYIRQIGEEARKFKAELLNEKNIFTRLRYKESDLMKIISMINGGGEVKKVDAFLPKGRFFAGTGLNMSKASYSGVNTFSGPNASSKTSFSPMLTAGFDLFANPAIGKLIYRAELAFLTSKNEITTSSNESEYLRTHKFNQLSVVLTPQIIYNFYNNQSLKIFGGAGFGFGFSKYSNNEFFRYNRFYDREYPVDMDIKFEKFNFCPQLSAGIIVYKKYELFGSYSFNSSITNYSYYNISMERVLIGARYLFGKH